VDGSDLAGVSGQAARLFGKIAEKKGLVTARQLERALGLQEELRVVGLHRPLGRVLVDEGVLAEGQVEVIVRLQAINQRARDGKAFGKVAVRNGLLLPAQLDRATAAARAEGWERTLEAILVDQGALEPRAVRAVRAALDRARRKASGASDSGLGLTDTASLTPGATPRPSSPTGRLAQTLDVGEDDAEDDPEELERARRREELVFAAVALRDGLVIVPELERALDEQLRRDDGATLPEVLLERRALDPKDVKAVRKAVEAARQEKLQVPGYEVVDVLGYGITSVVLRARHTLLGRQVALKLFRPEHVESTAADALLGEARQVARVKHPNVVEVYEVGRLQRRFWFVLELVDGPTLGARLREKGRLPEGVALRMVRDVARALEAVHKAGLVHRDVKPGNILFAPDGVAKLTDLGLACDAARAKAATDGALFGTPQTMAPEQAQGLEVDHRADLYGLGATLYQALTERPPYEGKDTVSLVMAHVTAPIPDPRALRPDLSPGLAELVLWLLAKSPGDRPQSARVVLEALDGLKAFA
jgi:hypothetical protein